MRLTYFTDYTLRVLIYLGLHQDRLVTINEIACAYEISRNHLMKIVHHQSQKGVIETVRGKGGGMRLGLLPSEICVGDIVRDTEQDIALVACFDPAHHGECRIESVCSLRHALMQASAAFHRTLDNYSQADLLRPRTQLSELFSLPANPT